MPAKPRKPGLVPAWDRKAVGVTYVYDAIAAHLAARIDAGEFPPGTRLPGERELSDEYEVGLGTLRKAVGVLRDSGRLVTLKAKGTFVAPDRDAPGGS